MREAGMYGGGAFRVWRRPRWRHLFMLSLLGPWLPSNALAGPLAGDLYVGVGGGIFAPDFRLENPPTEPDEQEEDAEELRNRDYLAIGALAGYKISDDLALEFSLGVTFPQILLNDLDLNVPGIVTGSDEEQNQQNAEIQVAPPDITPVALGLTYTLFPRSAIRPYLGFAGMLANLSNGQAQSSAEETFKWEEGVTFGYQAKVGVQLDAGEGFFYFAEVRYGRIDDPEIEDGDGNPVAVDKLEIRELVGGVAFTF